MTVKSSQATCVSTQIRLSGKISPETPFLSAKKTMEKRKRPIRLGVYFTRDEYAALRAKADAAGLSMGDFIRRAIAGKEVKQAPSADIPTLLMELHRAGNNVNQLLQKANSAHLLDAPQMRKVLARVYLAADKVVKAYTTEE